MKIASTVFHALAIVASMIGVLASAERAGATPIQFGSNYYDFVPTTYDLSWADASAAASASTFMGVNGYLATVTSARQKTISLRQLFQLSMASLSRGLEDMSPLTARVPGLQARMPD
jgi:hypothetical protein